MSASAIIAAQKMVARIGLSALLVFGNVGNVFTILILTRSAKRHLNSCSLYLLSACISNWIVINTALVSNIVGIDHIDPQHTSNAICKLRWSGTHALLMLSRSFMVAACVDRWALCSQNVTIRSFTKPSVAVKVILALILLWTIIPIHMAVFFNNTSGRCIALPGTYALFYAIYSVVVIGVLPLFLMVFFSLLAWHNLQQVRSRVGPIGLNRRHVMIQKRDRDLMKMLGGEVFMYTLTTIPYPINLIYSVSTTYLGVQKDPVRIAIENLIGYIISPLLNFMYCCGQFYVYAFSSNRFRRDFVNLLFFRAVDYEQTEHTNRSKLNSTRY